MGYWVTRFDTVDLETSEAAQSVGMARAIDGGVRLPGGGVYDAVGSDRAPLELPHRLTVRTELVRASLAEMKTAWYALRALHGKRARLYRTPDGGTANSEWAWARLVEMPADRRADQLLVLPFTMVFELLSPVWYGRAHDDTTILNTSPKSVTLTNGGNARVTNAILTITAVSAPITALTVSVAGVSKWTFSGTIAMGQALVVDCGARSVRNNGVDAYADFGLDPSDHLIEEWLRLEPGDNSLVVTITGGGVDSTVRVQFSDGWA